MWRDGKTMGIERSVVIGDWDGRGINYKGIQQEWLGGWVCAGVMQFFYILNCGDSYATTYVFETHRAVHRKG